ncbi:STAS domain-containing protein [Devosia sediminis]|uniref:STAS domain-containing protein n=1 Tax=Devosia sediminis TaxID=2798801 RepID=A0A934MN65_9HYPH|nr:STAS domain-containing protein [Devosia sediminis]MBJ3786915.1 STAS domain-containing protein [Devosia sediminis]
MTEERTYTLVLSGDAGIKSAKEVAGALTEAIDKHARIEVDTQTLSGADVTTVQTLLSARASAHARAKHLTLLAPLGGPLQAVLDAAGFLSSDQEHVGFWSALSDQPAGH